jgi:septal ring factor EnvC (AmiA/AmiB activator)
MAAIHGFPFFLRPGRLVAVFAFLTALLPVLLAAPSPSRAADSLQEKLQSTRARVRTSEQSIASLTRTERKLFKDLAGVEDRLTDFADSLKKLEQEQTRLQERTENVEAALKESDRQQHRLLSHLSNLLRTAWPIMLQARTDTAAHLESWGSSSRQGTWIEKLYAGARRDLEALRAERAKAQKQLSSLAELRKAATRKLAETEQSREELLDRRLAFLKKVQSVRTQKLKREEELRRVMAVIEEIQSKIKAMKSRRIKDLKGRLPWPVQGRLTDKYSPDSSPPRRGVGFTAPGDPTVRAVSWGKVVHNDQLRGFGRVVILTHGDNYYTLYAFLSETSVRSGQKVEKGEPLGQAGFYPSAKGPGLYFELRFGQKAINPEEWLRVP